LLARSLWQLTNVPTGFQAEGVVAVPVAVPESRYETAAARRVFFADALSRLAEIRAVQRVSAINRVPLGGSNVLSEWR